jgi:histidinol-phosphate/aromatic aminotransferase/cobyric acid decarboxylase-like protein/GTP:adenosylcobinamide-phosphate guanylyltransferase
MKKSIQKKVQAVILAAGRGLRLMPITDEIPKSLVEVNDTPFIINELEALSEHKEIEEVIVVVGYKKELIKERVGDKYNGMKITYIENDEWNKTNNIYSFWMARRYIKEDFILLEADLFFEHRLLNSLFENRGKNIVLLSKYKPYMSGTVIEINEKSKAIKRLIPASDQDINFDHSDKYKTINAYSFTYNFFKTHLEPNLNLYAKTHKQSYWELILGVLVYLNTPNIYPHVVDDSIKWYEIDDENDLEEANYMFADEKEKIKQISNLYGGYWRYDFLDFCFLFNLYFPPEHFYSKLSNELPQLIGNYSSIQSKISRLLSRWYYDDGFNENNIIVGNGASEFIRILNRHLIKKITIPVPTFNEYEDMNKKRINYYVLNEREGFSLDADEFIKSVNDSDSNFAVVINPNNPTSALTERQEIVKILKNLKHLDGIIVDESFIDFTGDREGYSVQPLVNKYSNLIVLRSLSKEFGVPGLRIGYLVSSNKNIKKKIKKHLPIWNINSVAERFIELFPKYAEEYRQSIGRIIAERDSFYKKLKDIKMLKVFRPYANFIFCKILNDDINSEVLCRRLFTDYNIFIKDCSNKTSLNDKFIRIAVRTKQDNNTLIEALREIEKELGG